MNEVYELELKPHQKHYLEEMAKKYELPDASKALRCLIQFMRQRPELETSVYETVRCSDC
jgi:hypothetical protein